MGKRYVLKKNCIEKIRVIYSYEINQTDIDDFIEYVNKSFFVPSWFSKEKITDELIAKLYAEDEVDVDFNITEMFIERDTPCGIDPSYLMPRQGFDIYELVQEYFADIVWEGRREIVDGEALDYNNIYETYET